MIIKAPAKLNLTLNVIGKRTDGYHRIETVMQTISLYDEISFEKSNRISVQTNASYIPNDSRNIAYKAAQLFFDVTKISAGVCIKINKKIPVGSGMGGGSSDAAAVLRGLNVIYKGYLSKRQLEEAGLKLGADVPYFFTKGPCIATGLGEILTPIKSKMQAWVVIVKPSFSVNTKQAYQKLDSRLFKAVKNTSAVVCALQDGNIQKMADNLYNIFESSAALSYSQIVRIKDSLKKSGALGAAMTGSGSAVYGIFENEKAAQQCAAYIKRFYKTVFIASFE